VSFRCASAPPREKSFFSLNYPKAGRVWTEPILVTRSVVTRLVLVDRSSEEDRCAAADRSSEVDHSVVADRAAAADHCVVLQIVAAAIRGVARVVTRVAPNAAPNAALNAVQVVRKSFADETRRGARIVVLIAAPVAAQIVFRVETPAAC